MVGSNEETMQADTKIVQGIEVQETHKYVTRPEVSLTVEKPLTVRAGFISYNDFKDRAREEQEREEDNDGTMRISLDPKGGQQGPVATGEIYRGEPVMKGPRGGKYVTKEGKKIYVPAGKAGDGSKQSESDVVYKINILS